MIQEDHKLPEGTQLKNGNYKLLKCIHEGNHHLVYLAEDTKSKKKVVVKELFLKERMQRSGLKAVLVEESFAAKLQDFIHHFAFSHFDKPQFRHPNLNKIIDRFEANGTAYHVSDFIKGTNLKDMVTKTGSFTEQQTLKLLLPVIDALIFLHEQNCWHGNIQPDNILINQKGEVFLTDISTVFFPEEHFDKEKKYNQGFSPIETYQKEAKLSKSSDIYSIGAVMYYTLTATVPVYAPDRITMQMPAPGHFTKGISKNTQEAIMKAMMLKPADRYQNAIEFYNKLVNEQWLADAVVGKLLQKIERQRAARLVKKKGSLSIPRKRSIFIVTLIIVLLLLFLQWWATH